MTRIERDKLLKKYYGFRLNFGITSDFYVPTQVAYDVAKTFINESELESRWKAAIAPYEAAAVDSIVDLCNRSHRETMRRIEIDDAWSRELEE
jgi:hypothetical protein